MGWTYTKALLASTTAPETSKKKPRKSPAPKKSNVNKIPKKTIPTTNSLNQTFNDKLISHDNTINSNTNSPELIKLNFTTTIKPTYTTTATTTAAASAVNKTTSTATPATTTTTQNNQPLHKNNINQAIKNKSSSPKTKTTKPSTTTKRKIQETDIDSHCENSSKTKVQQQHLPILKNSYYLKYVIQGYEEPKTPKKLKDGMDDTRNIWCCEFQPEIKYKLDDDNMAEIPKDVVAICGSYTVLFLDTLQGRYLKRYMHSEIQEIFYCMAWTMLKGRQQLLTTELNRDADGCSVLAVAGRLGSIKLLNPVQDECYRYLFGHRGSIMALTFSKQEPRWLFSASTDKTVRLWDIGSPTSRIDDSFCLAKFILPLTSGEPSSLSISYDLSTLIVGCNNGDLIKFTMSLQDIQKLHMKAKEYREKKFSISDKIEPMGPIITMESSHVFPHGDEWHEGHVDGVYILGQDGNTEDSIHHKIVSRSSDDMEILIWDHEKSTKEDIKIDVALEWPASFGETAYRFKVIEMNGQKAILGCDYAGHIRIFSIGNGKKSKTLPDNSKEQFPPTAVFSHDLCKENIKDICCSNDTRTIVAVDNENTVYIWASK